jgi:mRNA interferase RelE/StbE
MKLSIEYLKKSEKFFAKNSHILSKTDTSKLIVSAVKKIVLEEDINIDVKKLKGNLSQYYRIRKGKIRVLFELTDEKVIVKVIVNDIDFRGDVY